MLAAGMLLVFGIGTALIWAEQEALYSYDAGPAEIVGMLGGVSLLVAGVLAVAGRKTRAAATSDA